MAGRQTADIVFCMDASASMRPAFDGVRDHVMALSDALKGDANTAWDVRYEFVAYSTRNKGAYCTLKTVNLDTKGVLDSVYRSGANASSGVGLFTNKVEVFKSALSSVACNGDEAPAFALDVAADFPFRPASSCHRVIVLMTDEPMEHGTNIQAMREHLEDIAVKIQDRKIALYMVTPASNMYDLLSQIDRCEWTVVTDGEKGLADMNFDKLLSGIGKSVSVSSMQSIDKPIIPAPLYNEPNWTFPEDTERAAVCV